MKYRPRAEQLLAEREPLVTDLFWAAGFLEGEGNFAWNKSGTLGIACSQKQKEPVEMLQMLFGGGVSEYTLQPGRWRRNVTHMWRWQIYGERARKIMETLRPLMSPRRMEQIDAALARAQAWKTRKGTLNLEEPA